MTEGNCATKAPMRGGHVLAILIGFFAVIVAVDGFMIYRAVTTFGGVETPDAYRKGVTYNEAIARDEKQALLGWEDDVKVVGSPHRLQVLLRDNGKEAVAGKRIVATVGRPATDRQDVIVTLAETAPGLYEAVLPAAAEGAWIVDLSAYNDAGASEPIYQARRRAWIGP